MPDDPIVNDHYGDILWKLDIEKFKLDIFGLTYLEMENAEKEMIENINKK